jgi:putative membrane protein
VLQHLVVALKGMAFGLSNIVPGMTGGAILIVLGVYEQFVDAVGNLATNRARRREYITFLGALGLGAVVAMIGLARVLSLLLDWRPVLMMFLFIGLLLGTIPSLFRLHSDMRLSPKRLIGAGVGLVIVVGFRALERQGFHALLAADSGSVTGMMYALLTAIVAGAANVTPGISGSYVFLLAGTYQPILDALSALARLQIRWEVLVPTGAGAVLGIVLASKAIDAALKRAPAMAAYTILGLLVGSAYGLWPEQALQRESLPLILLSLAVGMAVPLLLGSRAHEPMPSASLPPAPTEPDALSHAGRPPKA